MITIYAGIKNGSKHINLNEFEGSVAHEFEEALGAHCGVSWWVLDGDEVRQPNADELQEREDAANLVRIEGLRSECLQYQSTVFRCDSNFYGLLMAGKASGTAGVKTVACLTALDMLWSLYELYKNDSDMDVEFEVAGVIPHSFDEIRAEINAS